MFFLATMIKTGLFNLSISLNLRSMLLLDWTTLLMNYWLFARELPFLILDWFFSFLFFLWGRRGGGGRGAGQLGICRAMDEIVSDLLAFLAWWAGRRRRCLLDEVCFHGALIKAVERLTRLGGRCVRVGVLFLSFPVHMHRYGNKCCKHCSVQFLGKIVSI